MRRWQLLCAAGLALTTSPVLAADPPLIPVAQAPADSANLAADAVFADGTPIYPQRPMLFGPIFTRNASGALPEGNFDGKSEYPVTSPIEDQHASATVKATHSFAAPGTHFPALRVYSQRDGDKETPFARIRNLGRVPVIVEE